MAFDPRSPQRDPTPDVSVVICTLNEHEAIGGVLRELDAALLHCRHEVIVVDDSSDERTARAVQDYARAHPWVRLLRRRGGRGLASAAVAGWDAARGRTLALMDGDGQHDPQLIARMLDDAAVLDSEVVIASRYLESSASGLGAIRHLGSRITTQVSRLLLGLKVADPMSGCFLMTRAWYQQVRPGLTALGFKILIDVLAADARRPRVSQVPTRLRERAGGSSKLDLRVVLELGAQLLEKATQGLVPARMALFFGVGISGLGVHLAALSLGTWAGRPFWLAQLLAIWLAMSWNFALNNLLTFRDRRLHGVAALRGLVVFYAACLSGAILSEVLGVVSAWAGAPWFVAGIGGALLAGVWNYHLAKRAAWGASAEAKEAVSIVESTAAPARHDA
ncbi:dolichol-phosphate mannosyltransferase [Pseudoxanthomonas sp. GM95]|uniref:glycosyltransferase n=1 Tax=Pseudoxanthomonas sp. GM95 TaxID=1881043 RepID=UPI0008CB0FB2|nr:glycosyltransferase [Pseudoxanthomonas sp. GM95]SEL63192.1 dolichol-phosphate mannosyltransferase [Pseudoxanthomonas sp. GM95]